MAEVWGLFVGKQNPMWFLEVVDQAVEAGRWSTRHEAFVDHAEFALEVLEPEAARQWTPQQLGRRLLAYAEHVEQASKNCCQAPAFGKAIIAPMTPGP